MRKSKRLSWLLAVIFVFTTMLGAVPSQAVAADLGDISNHWAKSQIESLIERGIVTGYPDNTFKPDNTITRAEFITMINKAYSFTATAQINYTDVPASAWYATEIAKAKAAGYIAGYEDGTMRPNAQISRQEAAKIVSTILKLDTSSDSALSAFTDAAAIPAWSRGYVAAMVKAGYITGYPDGTFKAGNAINRAEAAVILGRVIGAAPAVQKEFTKAGTYGPASGTQTINGDVVVNADGVILQNTIINGNLLVAEPVGEGSVNFKNVTVSGTTTIKGGGINSVTFDNCKVNIVVVNKPSSPVRVVFLNNSTTTKLQLDSAATVVGGGIAQAIVNADSIFDKTPTTYTVANGINAKFGSKSVTGPAEYTEPSSGGSSGGGGGGPVNVPVTGVSLSSNNLSIDKGHTATLTATITPTGATNQNLIWTSNNTSIASVSSGVVTALEGGNAIITVTTADGNYTDTCNVTVAGIAVETINFKRASLNLMVGAGGTSATLVPIIAPVNASDQTVTWESENTAIATVVNGLVTPIAAGVTSITATTNDGAKTATCVVTVTNAPVAVTDVNLNTETLTLAAGGAGYTLVEIIAPANATNTNVIWTSSNPAAASVNTKGVVTPLTKGSTTITVTTVDGSFAKDCVVTVTQPVTGILLNIHNVNDWFPDDPDKPLTAALSPASPVPDDQRVIWSSGDPTIASVEASGLSATVKALKAGSTAISATSVDGGWTDSCIVNVGTRVASVSLSPLNISLKSGGFNSTLTANVLPADATNTSLTWTSLTLGVATVSAAGVVTSGAVGTATIEAVPVYGTPTAIKGTATVRVYNVTSGTLSKSVAPSYLPDVKTLATVKFSIQGPSADEIVVKLSDGTVLQHQKTEAGLYTYSGSTTALKDDITSATVTINNAVSFTF